MQKNAETTFDIIEITNYLLLLPERKWNILIFHHMKYLSPQHKSAQHDPVEQKYWPKDRNIKYAEECQHKSNAECFGDRIPKQKAEQYLNKSYPTIFVTSF